MDDSTRESATKAAERLRELAVRYHAFEKDPQSFLDELPKLGEERLREYLTEIEGAEWKKKDGVSQISPVVFLRRVAITRILHGEQLSVDDLDEIVDRIEAKDVEYFADFPEQLEGIVAMTETKGRSRFANWTHFRLLFYVDYYWRSESVMDDLATVADAIQAELELPNLDRHLADFGHNQRFGTDWCWIALYPTEREDHRDAYQIFFGVEHDGFRHGTVPGSNVELDEGEYRDEEKSEDLDFSSVLDDLRGRVPRFFKVNQRLGQKPPLTRAEHPLNVILYGPPGTGKTYMSQRRAVEIIDGELDESDAQVADRFRELLADDRIEFVTFHPSYSYEEFVEGFRYDPDAKIPVLRDGTLKRVVQRAINPRRRVRASEGAQIWKVSLGDASEQHIFERCMKQNEIAIGWFPDKDLTGGTREQIDEIFDREGKQAETNNKRTVNYLVNEMRDGDYVAVLKDQRTIRAIGVVDGAYRYRADHEEYPHTRPVEWLDRNDHDIYELNGANYIGMPTIYKLNRVQLQDLLDLIPGTSAPKDRFVLVIDEINRGNIPRIFGELITLLEPDKRRGEQNELSARLPYSQMRLMLPSNLFIIGTMNTADRSIALLDVALRRRFQFEEMMPEAQVISEVLTGAMEEDEENELTTELVALLCEVFDALNLRITRLLDRDHQIGHSEFLTVRSIADLRRVFYRKVFPLLQEYFYNDRDRLVGVCGEYDRSAESGFIVTIEGDEGRDGLIEEMPWEFHEYRTGEFEEALKRTFLA